MYLYHRIDCILPASSKYGKSLTCYEILAMGILETIRNEKKKYFRMNNICNILLVVTSLHPGGEKRQPEVYVRTLLDQGETGK